MYHKRITELFSVLIFWMGLVPLAYGYCKKNNLIAYDKESLFTTGLSHTKFILCAIVLYFIFYRIVIYIYMKMTLCDIHMWHNMKKFMANPELQCNAEEKSHYKELSPKKNLDCVDTATAMTPNFVRTISDPLLAESELARIQTKHDTLPLKNVTLPRKQVDNHHVISSPTQNPGTPCDLSYGLIMEPNALKSTSQHQFSPV